MLLRNSLLALAALAVLATAPAVSVAAWGTNIIGIERPDQISRVVFSAPDFGFDGLTFENDLLLVLVPEPSTLSALAMGLVGMWGLAVLGSGQRAAAPAPIEKG